MPITSEDLPILSIACSVLDDAHDAKLAIQAYEGIGHCANDVKRTEFNFFFGFTQKVMLKFVVLQICKIYDKSNKSYRKHTVFEIVEYLKNHKESARYENIYHPNPNTYLKRSVFKQACTSNLSNIEDFSRNSEEVTNKIINNDDFKKLKTFRDKYIAHAEQVDPLEKIKQIASIDQINKFIDIAMDLSILIHNLFSPNSILVCSRSSMKVATENLIRCSGSHFKPPVLAFEAYSGSN